MKPISRWLTCAFCGASGCDARFFDQALQEDDVAHRRCLTERAPKTSRELVGELFAREEP